MGILMDATMRPLEKRFSLYLLLLVYRNPGQSKSWLFNQDGKNFRIKGDRLDELEQMGLVRYDKAPRISNVILVYPTDAGAKIAEAILSVYPDIRQQECDPEDY